MNFINSLNALFSELYQCDDLKSATKKSEEILKKLSEKGLVDYDVPIEKDIYRQSFRDYLSTFNLNPNPNLSKLEGIRIIVRQSFRYDE